MQSIVDQLNDEQSDYFYHLGRNNCSLIQQHFLLSVWKQQNAISVHHAHDMPKALAKFAQNPDRHRPEHPEAEARAIGFERFEPASIITTSFFGHTERHQYYRLKP
jgi:hypothetical protein